MLRKQPQQPQKLEHQKPETPKKEELAWGRKTCCTATIGPNGIMLQQYDGKITQFARFKKIATVDFYSKNNVISIKNDVGDVLMTIGGSNIVGIDVDQLYVQIQKAMVTFWTQI